jgi:nicotinamide mononucleotide transporter
MIKRNIWCWSFGILASLLSIFLFVEVKLYSEAVLYLFYIIMGIYGWFEWKKDFSENSEIIIQKWNFSVHIKWILVCIFGIFSLGYYFSSSSDAVRPYADASTTIFSFLATYMETKKILSSWYFWIVINAFSVWLYAERGLFIYSAQMIIFAILSVVGLLRWMKDYRIQKTNISI